MMSEEKIQYPLLTAIGLHLMPGAVQVIFFSLLAPLVMRAGFPSGFAFIFVNIFIGMPLMLGYLFYRGRRHNGGKASLRGVVSNLKPMPLGQYFLFFVLLFGFAFVVLFLTSPLNSYLEETVFAWLPAFFHSSQTMASGEPTRNALLLMFLLQLTTDGLALPIVEEIYYRGHLMPAVSYLGAAAPIFNAFFFTLNHFWQPYNYLLIFLIVSAQAYVAWRKENIYITMLTHCAGNSLGAILSLLALTSS
ncbi:MAG TPA: CPBP family intramembrane glutamic endopeptidase [Pyrinomonadaceae bacterium]|jgi:hypothetical protein